MITLEQALNLQYGDIIHENGCTIFTGNRGGKRAQITEWKVNGKVQTWKTRPTEFKIPLSWGLYEHGYLTELNASQFHLDRDCTPEYKQTNSINGIRRRGW